MQRAGNPVDRAGLPGDVRGDHPSRQDPGGEAEPQSPFQLTQDRGEAECRALRRPVGVVEPAPGDADVGMTLHESDQLSDRPRSGDRVGVQQEDIARRVGRLGAGRIAALLPAANPSFRSRG